jgi:hypothetical protein
MSEIAHMRGLLDEMGWLGVGTCVDCANCANCAHVAEAPTKMEGFKSVARRAVNLYG